MDIASSGQVPVLVKGKVMDTISKTKYEAAPAEYSQWWKGYSLSLNERTEDPEVNVWKRGPMSPKKVRRSKWQQ